jgi:DNA-binding MarR family transcriptional regulator
MADEKRRIGADLGRAVQGYQATVDDFDRELARLLGVNETDLRCLEVLLTSETTAPSTLRTRLGLSSGSVTAMLDRLEKLDYLTRTPHPTDRRKSEVRITPRASALVHRLMGPYLADSTEQVLDRYSARELELVIDFLDFTRSIQQHHLQRLRELTAAPES